MTQRKRRKLGEIEQEISVCKANLSLSEGKIIGSLARNSSPFDSRLNTPSTASKEQPPSNDEVVLFIKHLTKLKDTLEEKNAILQSQSERNNAVLESQLTRLQSEVKTMKEREKYLLLKEEEAKVLGKRVAELQGQLQKKLNEENQQLKHYRKENTEVKLENRSLKADNKVIMNHLDRLTKEIKEGKSNSSSLEQRELRVMKSLYQQTLPNIELRESQRRNAILEEPRHRIAAQDAVERNGELKALIRRLNEEVQMLRRQKELLMQENRQKHLNLENQRQLVAMAEEEKAKQDNLIRKMGDKIMSLEEINLTLREAASKEEEGEDQESYYRTTRTKAGQFYYRK